MLKRITAIGFIFVCASLAWGVLGATIFSRTYSSRGRLGGRIASTWGARQEQAPPAACYYEARVKETATIEEGRKTVRAIEENVSIPLPLESSRVDVSLNLEPRRKGLLWYSTYKVSFAGTYVFRNTSGKPQTVAFTLPFPSARAIYDNLQLQADGVPLEVENNKTGATARAGVGAGKPVTIRISYASQGLDSWSYKLGADVAQARDFSLRVRTNFQAVDFPENTLSPTVKREIPGGWDLGWNYRNLVSGVEIRIDMPEKLQPGPIAGRISLFAPVSLFFFFFLLLLITTLRGIELHPMNYFFLAGAFFSFHLLLAYLADHISIHAAFLVSSAVSVFLVVSYLRLVTGLRFAAVEAGLAQIVYLVLFSYAFFFEGYTGLTVTAGSIATLFAAMQLTGRVRWAEKFARQPA